MTGLASADWPLLYAGETGSEYLDKAEEYYMTLFNAPGAVSALLHAMVCCLLPAAHAFLPESLARSPCTYSSPLLSRSNNKIGICLIALSSKVARWEETNLFFDGSSLGELRSERLLSLSISPPTRNSCCRERIGGVSFADALSSPPPLFPILPKTALMIAAVAMYASVSVPNLRIIARMPLEAQAGGIGGKLRRFLSQPMPTPDHAAAIPEPLEGQLRYEVISLLCASNNLIIAALVGVLLFQAAQAYAHSKFEKEMKRLADMAKKQEKSQ